MDTISISALVSLPEPTQAQANVLPVAQSANSLSFSAVLAASSQPTKDLEATISVDAPANGATLKVNNLTVPPHVMVEAVVAAINVAISLAALKSATEALPTDTGSPQRGDNAWTPDLNENHNLDYQLQGMSEAAAIVVTIDHDAPILNAPVETNAENAPNIVTERIANLIEREPTFPNLSNDHNLAPSLTIRSDADHASPQLHHENTISSDAVQEPLHDFVPNIGSEQHRAATETQEAKKLNVPDAFPEVTTLCEPEQEAHEITAVAEPNFVVATNANDGKTQSDNSNPGLASDLTPKHNAPHISEVNPADPTTQSMFNDTRPLKSSITPNSQNIGKPTGEEIMALSHDNKPHQRAAAKTETDIIRIVDSTIKKRSSDQNAEKAASFEASGANTDRNQNGSISKTASSNLHALSDQVPNIELHADQKLALRDDATRPTERRIVESTNLDEPLSSAVIQPPDANLMIRASLEQVAAATQSLIKISQERPATTPDPVTNLKISDHNIRQTMRSFENERSLSQEKEGQPSDTPLRSKNASSATGSVASTLRHVPDFRNRTPDTSLVRLPHAIELIVSATAYIAPTNSEQEVNRQSTDTNAKTSAASTEDSTIEADEVSKEPDETLARVRRNDGKQNIDAATRSQTPAETINTDNPGLLRTDKSPTIQARIPPESPDSLPENLDARPRQISEDIRLRALERQVVIAAREGANQIRMQLYPPGMGQVLIRLALDGSKLRLQFRTSSSEATSSLHDVEDALRNALGDSGFTITSFDVSDDSSDAHDERRHDRNVVKPAPRQQETSPFSFELQA